MASLSTDFLTFCLRFEISTTKHCSKNGPWCSGELNYNCIVSGVWIDMGDSALYIDIYVSSAETGIFLSRTTIAPFQWKMKRSIRLWSVASLSMMQR